MVDEAIVILKPNIKIKNMQMAKNNNTIPQSSGKDLIVKEAESVINEYINKLNEKALKNKNLNLENKVKILKITNFMLFAVLIISMILFKFNV